MIALFAAAVLAQAKPAPTCKPELEGVIWNFGTDDAPALKRCDGRAYLPWTPKTTIGPPPSRASGQPVEPPIPAAMPPQPQFGKDKKQCEEACDKAGRDCQQRRCEMDMEAAACRKRCTEIRVSCRSKCQ